MAKKDPEAFKNKMEEYELKEKIKEELGAPVGPDQFLEAPSGAPTGPEVDTRMRNNLILRSRDDVPHYLRPLEKKSTGVDADLQDRLDQFSGDRLKFLEQERFAWNLIENQKQAVVNSAALPTATELLFRKGKKAAEERQKELANAIEELYGKQEGVVGEGTESPEEAADEAARWLEDTRRKEDPSGDKSEANK